MSEVHVMKGGRKTMYKRGHRHFGPVFALQTRLQG